MALFTSASIVVMYPTQQGTWENTSHVILRNQKKISIVIFVTQFSLTLQRENTKLSFHMMNEHKLLKCDVCDYETKLKDKIKYHQGSIPPSLISPQCNGRYENLKFGRFFEDYKWLCRPNADWLSLWGSRQNQTSWASQYSFLYLTGVNGVKQKFIWLDLNSIETGLWIHDFHWLGSETGIVRFQRWLGEWVGDSSQVF